MLFIAEKPKNYPGYQEISTNFEQANDTLELSEFRFQKLSDGWLLLCRATKLTTVFENNRQHVKPDSLYALLLHSSEYEKNKKQGDTWVKEKIQPSEFEKYFCGILDADPEKWLSKSFTGKLNIIGNADTIEKVSILGENGFNIFLDAKEIEATGILKELSDSELAASKKSGYSAAKGQTEYEKLTDRWKFVCEKLGLENPEKVCLLELLIHLDQLIKLHPESGERMNIFVEKLLTNQ